MNGTFIVAKCKITDYRIKRAIPPASRSTQGIMEIPIFAPSFMPFFSMPSDISVWRFMRCTPRTRNSGDRVARSISDGIESTAADVASAAVTVCSCCWASIEVMVLKPISKKLLIK